METSNTHLAGSDDKPIQFLLHLPTEDVITHERVVQFFTFTDPQNPTYHDIRNLVDQEYRRRTTTPDAPGLPDLPPYPVGMYAHVCIHPASSLFTDPRPPHLREPLRTRRAILWELLNEYTAMNKYHQDCLHHLVDSHLDPLVGTGTRDLSVVLPEVQVQRTFPNFTRLPAELRSRIWLEALPTGRVLNLGMVHKGLQLPVPQIAFTCREAYEVIMHIGVRISFNRGSSRWRRDDDPNYFI